MQKYILKRSEGRAVCFVGVALCTVRSSPDQSHPDFSGSTGRWSEYTLYVTKAGKYVCSKILYTQWQGEWDKHIVEVKETTEGVFEFFGDKALALELYERSGLNFFEYVE